MIGIRRNYFTIERVRNCMNNRRREGAEEAKEQAGLTGSGNPGVTEQERSQETTPLQELQASQQEHTSN